MLEYLEKVKSISKNNHYYKRYEKLIKHAYYRTNILYFEKHHIAPKALFPEVSKKRKNLIKLTPREHYLAHWILAKCTKNNSMWFAFNMMKRIIQGDNKKSALYEKSRKYVAEAISECNSGRKMSEENKMNMSNRTLGTVVVKNEDGDIFRVTLDDERYISGELKYYRVGSKHKKSTIEKMKTSARKKTTPFYNKKENRYYFFKKNYEPEGDEWQKGFRDEYKEKMSNSISNLLFYHDPLTHKNIRIKKDELPPEGYVKGRYFETNKGLEIANSLTNVIDLKNKKSTKCNNIEEYHAPPSGTNTIKTNIIVYEGYIFTNLSSIYKYLGFNFEKILNPNNLKTFVIPKEHYKMNTEKYNFCLQNKGKTLFEIGFYICPLLEYDYEYYKKQGNKIWWN